MKIPTSSTLSVICVPNLVLDPTWIPLRLGMIWCLEQEGSVTFLTPDARRTDMSHLVAYMSRKALGKYFHCKCRFYLCHVT